MKQTYSFECKKDIQEIDSSTLKVTINVQNQGVVSTIADRTKVVVQSGSQTSAQASIYENSMPFMISNSTLSFSFIWNPTDQFQGYLWASYVNLDLDTVTNVVNFPVYLHHILNPEKYFDNVRYIPSLQGASYAGKVGGENGTSLIEITAQLTNEIDITFANASIPVSLYPNNSAILH